MKTADKVVKSALARIATLAQLTRLMKALEWSKIDRREDWQPDGDGTPSYTEYHRCPVCDGLGPNHGNSLRKFNGDIEETGHKAGCVYLEMVG